MKPADFKRYTEFDSLVKFSNYDGLISSCNRHGYDFISELIEKEYYKPKSEAQVGKMLGVVQSTIRRWMTVFEMPKRPAGNRGYDPTLMEIFTSDLMVNIVAYFCNSKAMDGITKRKVTDILKVITKLRNEKICGYDKGVTWEFTHKEPQKGLKN
jgi:hypothetical protein